MKKATTLIALFAALFSLASAPAKEKEKMEVALGGYCPVCYIAAGKANEGKAEFSSKYNGKTYYFVSEETKGMFEKEPAKWLPQYDGWCAYGMALGKKFKSDPTAFTVVDGKVYLNKDASVSKLFRKDSKGFVKKADEQWKTMSMKKDK